MKLLVINPNITESVTQLIGAEAKRAASPGTAITMLTAPFGVAYIETRLEALIGGYASLLHVAEHVDGHDAVVIAAFGDPGVPAIREALDVPVVGMTAAALASASLLGQRFSVVAISRRITAWYRESIEGYGFAGRLASIRSLDRPLRDIGNVQGEHGAALKEICMSCIKEDGADVIILAGAPLAGLARGIAGQIPVPVVDGVSSAVRHAESLAALKPGAATAGSCSAPPSKPNAGLPPALMELLRRSAAE
jgi:Asp/Glu/hydantoin racemase